MSAVAAFFLLHFSSKSSFASEAAENPDSYHKQLIAELQALQIYPDKKGKTKAVLQREVCPNCHIKGHAEKDCWGQC